MIEEDLARVLRHRNDGFTHPFATDRSSGTEDFARLLRTQEGAPPEVLARVLDAVDMVATSHQGCHTCRGRILVFAELLSIQRLPERHAVYAGATECLAKEAGRDFRREVLEHLASCYRPVRPRLRARELLECYQDMKCRSPWALHLEGFSEELATQLSGKAEWILVVGKTASEKVMEVIRSHRSPGKQDRLTFAIAELIHADTSSRDRCAIFWSNVEGIPVHLPVMDAMPEGAAAVTCLNTQLRIYHEGEAAPHAAMFERVNEALRVLLGLESSPLIQALGCHSGFEAWARHTRGEMLWFVGPSRPKRQKRSQDVLSELRRRRQQSVEDALADKHLREEVRRLLLDCLPLWKDEPETLIGDLIPPPRRRTRASLQSEGNCKEVVN
jgi:hypothetical protein